LEAASRGLGDLELRGCGHAPMTRPQSLEMELSACCCTRCCLVSFPPIAAASILFRTCVFFSLSLTSRIFAPSPQTLHPSLLLEPIRSNVLERRGKQPVPFHGISGLAIQTALSGPFGFQRPYHRPRTLTAFTSQLRPQNVQPGLLAVEQGLEKFN
jgi:hypothetical protein